MPKVEDLLAELAGAKVFSILDANMGFYQIPIDQESSRLCTFSSPFGRYVFKRLPFGVSPAPNIIYKSYKQIFENVPGNACYINDLLVYGSDQERQDKNLKLVLEKAKQANIKFNKMKCKFNLSEIKFVGPSCREDIENFLGLVTYVAKFVPKLSEKTAKLRELLNKKSVFAWDNNHTVAFENIKKALTSTPIICF